jgi:hypothetical protein
MQVPQLALYGELGCYVYMLNLQLPVFFYSVINDLLSESVLCSACDRMINRYGAVCGTKIGRWGQSTQRKPSLLPHCSLNIPHDLT